MATEVTVTIWFGNEPPDQGEVEAAIQERYPDAYIIDGCWDEEEV